MTVRELRLKYDISLSELAVEAMTTKQYISDIELGKRPTTDEMKSRLLSALSVIADKRLAKHRCLQQEILLLQKHLLEEL